MCVFYFYSFLPILPTPFAPCFFMCLPPHLLENKTQSFSLWFQFTLHLLLLMNLPTSLRRSMPTIFICSRVSCCFFFCWHLITKLLLCCGLRLSEFL